MVCGALGNETGDAPGRFGAVADRRDQGNTHEPCAGVYAIGSAAQIAAGDDRDITAYRACAPATSPAIAS